MIEPRFYIMKNGDYCTHKPTPAKAVEAALVHCYFALDGDRVEVIDPAGEIAWSATVEIAR